MSKFPQLLGAAAVIGLIALPAQAQMHFRYNGPWETPEQNNIRSAHYDRLLETNPGFRAYRIRKECNPIDFVQNLRQDCVQSFDQYEPMGGAR
ncbi:MAG: hypothetical protein JO032_05680 [Alphaproteobacteria bacterium]|nr:hypothetical protein [Alphaproteobacteria bacterium]MBV9552266.1 hypothetical protein [Alphaproteobacteria bacterium]